MYQVRSYVKKLNPDVIVSFMWDINLFVLLSCVGLHKKVIISERAYPNMKINNKLRKLWKEFGQRYVYLLANTIVLQTEQVRQYYSTSVQKKCVIIPNPISPDIPDVWNNEREKSSCSW